MNDATYEERERLVSYLFYKARANGLPLNSHVIDLVRSFTIGYQVGESSKWMCFLIRDIVPDNLTMVRVMNLYQKWGKQYGCVLRIYNTEKDI